MTSRRCGPWLTASVFVLLLSTSLATIDRCLVHFQAPTIYSRDFFQDYVAVKTASRGGDAYRPFLELAEEIEPEGRPYAAPIRHPTPHPPAALLFFSWAALLPFAGSAVVWSCAQLAFLGVAFLSMRRAFFLGSRLSDCALAGAVAIGAYPVAQDLLHGQLNLVLLALLTALFLALQSGREGRAGVALGAMFSLKLFGAPILLHLALERRWRAVGVAIATLVVSTSAAALFLGVDQLAVYFGSVLPEVAARYVDYPPNISVWLAGERLFGGLAPEQAGAPRGAALVAAPALAAFTSMIAFTIVLVSSLVIARRAPLAIGLGALAIASVIVSPVNWAHGLAVTIFSFGAATAALRDERFPQPASILWLLLGLAAFLPSEPLYGVWSALGFVLPRALGSALPLVWAVALLVALGRLRGKREG